MPIDSTFDHNEKMNQPDDSSSISSGQYGAGQQYAGGSRSPAWLFSVLFHALLLPLVFLIFAPNQPKGLGGGDETSREVSIVVARASKYEPVKTAESAATSAAVSSNDPLPIQTSESPSLPDVELPAKVDNPLATVGAPSLAARGNPQVTSSVDYGDILAEENALRRARAAQGDAVNMSLFGGPNAQGRSFVFVVDRSKSMGSSGLDALDALAIELETALAHLEPNHKFTVIAYHHEPFYLEGRKLLSATAENKEKIATFFRRLAAFGQTEHELGLKAALYLNPDVIYLLTDGGLPALEKPQRDLIAREARRSGTTIHSVHFGSRSAPRDNHFLRFLAKENGGTYSYVNMRK